MRELADRLTVRVALIAIAVAAPLLTVVPTWYGHHVATPPARVFLGFRHMPGDHYMYASFVRQARDSVLPRLENRFTSEPQDGRYVLLYFWLLGLVTRAIGASVPADASVPVVWESFRVLGGVLYVLGAWRLLGLYVTDPRRRLAATALFAFGGGLDWIVTLLRLSVWPGIAPAEQAYEYFWNWSVFGALAVGHWVWASLLVVTLWTWLGRGSSRVPGSPGRVRASGGRGVVGGRRPSPHDDQGGPSRPPMTLLVPLVWFVHPYTGMVAIATMLVLPAVPIVTAALTPTAVSWSRARANLVTAAPALAASVVVVAYLLWARGDMVFRLNSAITYAWLPHYTVGWYPLTYGLVLGLAWFGLRVTVREATLAADLLLAWTGAAFLLSVNPFYQGIKFQYQLYPPLAILAARGLFHLADTYAPVREALRSLAVRAALVIALGLNAPLAIAKELPPTGQNDEIYYSAAELDAMRWLDARPPGVVLCGYKCGNLAPWLAGKTAFFGHWGMTLGITDKARSVSWFFSREAPLQVKRDILRGSRARYVLAGPSEQTAGGVDARLGLREVYRNPSVVIYEVPVPGPS